MVENLNYEGISFSYFIMAKGLGRGWWRLKRIKSSLGPRSYAI
jgi:hypothetical protein